MRIFFQILFRRFYSIMQMNINQRHNRIVMDSLQFLLLDEFLLINNDFWIFLRKYLDDGTWLNSMSSRLKHIIRGPSWVRQKSDEHLSFSNKFHWFPFYFRRAKRKKNFIYDLRRFTPSTVSTLYVFKLIFQRTVIDWWETFVMRELQLFVIKHEIFFSFI